MAKAATAVHHYDLRQLRDFKLAGGEPFPAESKFNEFRRDWLKSQLRLEAGQRHCMIDFEYAQKELHEIETWLFHNPVSNETTVHA